ncbi:hypothetical protein [uncultured Jannaschia sp.]|uniref:hypothetical protein n=1 Tax=uncultured Jannaschia sp. TaxID=293347 RepID=UPI00261A3F88|nr:hypothetical protein [uncultured Jannaschia sp.]
MDRFLALAAFATLAGFLAVLAIEVPSGDLIAVIVLTVALVGYDFVSSSGRDRND